MERLCKIRGTTKCGAVAELADAGDLKSPGLTHVGSSPTRPTIKNERHITKGVPLVCWGDIQPNIRKKHNSRIQMCLANYQLLQSESIIIESKLALKLVSATPSINAHLFLGYKKPRYVSRLYQLCGFRLVEVQTSCFHPLHN